MTSTAHPMTRGFKQVDVFTATPYLGNPLAVVLDGSGLGDDEMQRFARWTHLSETTFVLPPTKAGADYRVRIFTPGAELPFAGHPTLGTCHAWLQAGGAPKQQDVIVQECQVGLVTIRRAGHQLAFAAPPLKRSAPAPTLLVSVAAALGLVPTQIRAAQLLDNGPVWLGLLLDSPDTVLALNPNHPELIRLNQKVGVAALLPAQQATNLIARGNWEARAFAEHGADAPVPADADLEVRAFAAPAGIIEDPVTGSLNASLAQWLIGAGLAPDRYVASQGTCIGREGRLFIRRDESTGTVWVGGQTSILIEGTLTL